VVGSTIAGVVVAAVALTVSLPVCVATIAFFIAARLIEDYLLVPGSSAAPCTCRPW
jgi:predicted PurR-regulated permease PerM